MEKWCSDKILQHQCCQNVHFVKLILKEYFACTHHNSVTAILRLSLGDWYIDKQKRASRKNCDNCFRSSS